MCAMCCCCWSALISHIRKYILGGGIWSKCTWKTKKRNGRGKERWQVESTTGNICVFYPWHKYKHYSCSISIARFIFTLFSAHIRNQLWIEKKTEKDIYGYHISIGGFSCKKKHNNIELNGYRNLFTGTTKKKIIAYYLYTHIFYCNFPFDLSSRRVCAFSNCAQIAQFRFDDFLFITKSDLICFSAHCTCTVVEYTLRFCRIKMECVKLTNNSYYSVLSLDLLINWNFKNKHSFQIESCYLYLRRNITICLFKNADCVWYFFWSFNALSVFAVCFCTNILNMHDESLWEQTARN